jgi:hypothetical protein
LLRNTKEARELKKQIRRVDKELAANGYTQNELSPEVVSNLEADEIFIGHVTKLEINCKHLPDEDTMAEVCRKTLEFFEDNDFCNDSF